MKLYILYVHKHGCFRYSTLQWRRNERDGASNHRCLNCLLNRLLRRRSKKISKLCGIGLCERNSSGTGEFHAQRASNAENVSIWWRHHEDISWRMFTLLHPSLFLIDIYSVTQNCRILYHIKWDAFWTILWPVCFFGKDLKWVSHLDSPIMFLLAFSLLLMVWYTSLLMTWPYSMQQPCVNLHL